LFFLACALGLVLDRRAASHCRDLCSRQHSRLRHGNLSSNALFGQLVVSNALPGITFVSIDIREGAYRSLPLVINGRATRHRGGLLGGQQSGLHCGRRLLNGLFGQFVVHNALAGIVVFGHAISFRGAMH